MSRASPGACRHARARQSTRQTRQPFQSEAYAALVMCIRCYPFDVLLSLLQKTYSISSIEEDSAGNTESSRCLTLALLKWEILVQSPHIKVASVLKVLGRLPGEPLLHIALGVFLLLIPTGAGNVKAAADAAIGLPLVDQIVHHNNNHRDTRV